jgi:hypothetical protein
MSNLMLSSHTEFLCFVEQALQAARINLIDMHVEASQVTKKFWQTDFYSSNLVQGLLSLKVLGELSGCTKNLKEITTNGLFLLGL